MSSLKKENGVGVVVVVVIAATIWYSSDWCVSSSFFLFVHKRLEFCCFHFSLTKLIAEASVSLSFMLSKIWRRKTQVEHCFFFVCKLDFNVFLMLLLLFIEIVVAVVFIYHWFWSTLSIEEWVHIWYDVVYIRRKKSVIAWRNNSLAHIFFCSSLPLSLSLFISMSSCKYNYYLTVSKW